MRTVILSDIHGNYAEKCDPGHEIQERKGSLLVSRANGVSQTEKHRDPKREVGAEII